MRNKLPGNTGLHGGVKSSNEHIQRRDDISQIELGETDEF